MLARLWGATPRTQFLAILVIVALVLTGTFAVLSLLPPGGAGGGPAPPSAPSFRGITSDGATASWTQAVFSNHSAVMNDTVLVGTTCGTWTTRLSTEGAAVTYYVGNLSPNTAYCVAIQAWNATASSTSSSASFSTTPVGSNRLHIRVEFLATDRTMYQSILANDLTLLQPADSFVIYSLNKLGSPPIGTMTAETNALYAAAPGAQIFWSSGWQNNTQILANGVVPHVTGIAATYEPTGATQNNSSNNNVVSYLDYFTQTTAIAHAAGIQGIAYVTGSVLDNPSLERYHWDYSQMATVADQVWVETQQLAERAVSDPPTWTAALANLTGEFNARHIPLSDLTIQVNAGVNNNGVGSPTATLVTAVQTALSYGITNVYLWTGVGYEANLTAFLQAFTNRSITSGLALAPVHPGSLIVSPYVVVEARRAS